MRLFERFAKDSLRCCRSRGGVAQTGRSASSMTEIRTAIVLVALTIGACSSPGVTPVEETSPAQSQDTPLAFRNGILQQTDAQGQMLWRIKVGQAAYQPNQKTVQVQDLEGELFQDGRPVFHIQAKQGEIHQESQRIALKGKIVAWDIQDKGVLQGHEMEWRPQDDLLILRRSLRITYPQLQIAAKEAYASSRVRQVKAQGQVVAVTHQPKLRLRAEQMTWQVAQQQIAVASNPQNSTFQGIRIERLTGQASFDQAMAGQAEVNLKAQSMTLHRNARLSLLDPPLEVASQQLIWNLERQWAISRQPIYVQHRGQKITVTAAQGKLNLAQKRVQFTGSVQTAGTRNRSLLKTDQLTWLIPTQAIEAEGNVVYQQNQPRFELRGPKAFGKFRQQAVLISGGDVVTEIVP